MHLQKAGINIKEPIQCNTTLSLKTTRITELRDHQICAGDSEIISDTCEADSGGPFTLTFGNWKSLVGVTSFGPNACNREKLPGVYTRVSSFIDWIEEKVKQDFKDIENES